MKDFLKKHVALVVIILAVLIAATNYLVYPLFIKRQLNIIEVPVATTTLSETTKIDESMITYVEMVDDYLPSGVALTKEYLIGKYVKEDCTIAENGFFYAEYLSDTETALGKIYRELNEGEVAYNLAVSAKYMENNAIIEGQYIAVYVHIPHETEAGKEYIFGQIADNVRVLAISEDKTVVTLALQEDDVAYFNLAALMGNNSNGEDTTIFLPTVNSGSDTNEYSFNSAYDINSLRGYIADNNNILNLPVIDYMPEVEVEVDE